MKNKLLYSLLIVFSFFLIGCSKNKQKVELTIDNIEDYFIIETNVNNFKTEEFSFPFYEMSATADINVSARLKEDIDFEGVTINGTIDFGGIGWYTINDFNASFDYYINIDKDGKGSYEGTVSSNRGLLTPEIPNVSTNTYTNVSGNVFE